MPFRRPARARQSGDVIRVDVWRKQTGVRGSLRMPEQPNSPGRNIELSPHFEQPPPASRYDTGILPVSYIYMSVLCHSPFFCCMKNIRKRLPI